MMKGFKVEGRLSVGQGLQFCAARGDKTCTNHCGIEIRSLRLFLTSLSVPAFF